MNEARLGVGIIGCGNISTTYLDLGRGYRDIRLIACADLDRSASDARASEFGVRAASVDELLADPEIDIVVNLTVPSAHLEVSRAVLQAGKHVYSEKPFVLSVKDGRALQAIASERGLRIGSAPDTFLGGAHQQARALIDEGRIGAVTGGTAHVLSCGVEHWHPNPDFFFQPDAGPILDIGPYYVTQLVQLIGPVRRVQAMSSTPRRIRTISSAPRAGDTIEVNVATTVHALLEFANGARITLGASWDVLRHEHPCMELHGERGTLSLPDPNFFGGTLRLGGADAPMHPLDRTTHPFAVDNQQHPDGMKANWRVAGLADMALAIRESRPHRCSDELALHVIDVLTSILAAGETGQVVELVTSCERPAPLSATEAARLLA